ncbi:MAG: hypothetical protein ACLR23_26280 [Clostridia bacterium]
MAEIYYLPASLPDTILFLSHHSRLPIIVRRWSAFDPLLFSTKIHLGMHRPLSERKFFGVSRDGLEYSFRQCRRSRRSRDAASLRVDGWQHAPPVGKQLTNVAAIFLINDLASLPSFCSLDAISATSEPQPNTNSLNH